MRLLRLALVLLSIFPLLASLLVSAAPAHAAGINLAWDDCYAGAGSISRSDSCTAVGIRRDALVVSLELSAGEVLEDINGAQGTIDVRFDDVVQPDYWRLESGGCYGGALSVDLLVGSANPPFTCAEPWSQVGGVAGGVLFQSFVSCNNRARIYWLAAVQGTMTLSETTAQEWYLAKLNFVRNGFAGCSGCGVAGCLVLWEVRLTKPAGTPGGDLFLTSPATSQHVHWQSDWGCPSTHYECPTPVHSRTWGSVKELYR